MTFQWIGKSADGNTVTLHKLSEKTFKLGTPSAQDSTRMGVVIDVETTGLRHDQDKIIELGLRTFQFDRFTGAVLSLEESYSAFQDPGEPLSKEISMLTGITDEMLKNQKIDWEKAGKLLSHCQLIIAHNASFDRPFIDAKVPESKNKIWGCSFKQIDWNQKGFGSSKLDLLSIYHGFFTDAHRALNDSDALLCLLSQTDSTQNKPYLLELLSNAKKPSILISALYSPFETKDLLRARNYRWNAEAKCWSKEVLKEEESAEIAWLEEAIYKGKFKGRTLEIQAVDRFKQNTDL